MKVRASVINKVRIKRNEVSEDEDERGVGEEKPLDITKRILTANFFRDAELRVKRKKKKKIKSLLSLKPALLVQYLLRATRAGAYSPRIRSS